MSGNIYEIRKLEIKKLPKWKKIYFLLKQE
jgi:hypothetical protein